MTDSSSSAARNNVGSRALRAGPLSLLFDGGGLRYIRLGERELVRRVYCAVRDANWGTVPDRIKHLQADVGEASFRVEFDVENIQADIDFLWHGVITGEASGRIVFEFQGQARSSFRKNRIGFCVLHPLGLAGERVVIRHADGSREETTFPRYVAPYDPFLNITGMLHAAGPSAELELSFEGEVFETEDQRNWLDASFKTFCTPLSQPFPMEVRAGKRIFQRVTIELYGAQPGVAAGRAANHGRPDEIQLTWSEAGPQRVPQIGFDLPGDLPELGEVALQRLRALKPAHLRCELRRSMDQRAALATAARLAEQLSARLDVAVYLGSEPTSEVEQLVELVHSLRPPVARWTVFPEVGWATTRPLAEAAQQLRAYDPHIPIGGGTPANFLELNRNRSPVDLLDFVVWSQNPQVHASDEASMIETLEAHAALLESARLFAGGLPLVVGPITLKPRVNPYATGPWPPPAQPSEPPPDIEPRQRSPFAAAWTLGSIKHIAEGGVLAATYYEPVGDKGLIESDGSPLTLYHVFAAIAELPQAEVLPVKSPAPLVVVALALRHGARTRVLVANLAPQPQSVLLPTAAQSAQVGQLGQREERVAAADGCIRLELQPHAVVRADWIVSGHG